MYLSNNSKSRHQQFQQPQQRQQSFLPVVNGAAPVNGNGAGPSHASKSTNIENRKTSERNNVSSSSYAYATDNKYNVSKSMQQQQQQHQPQSTTYLNELERQFIDFKKVNSKGKGKETTTTTTTILGGSNETGTSGLGQSIHTNTSTSNHSSASVSLLQQPKQQKSDTFDRGVVMNNANQQQQHDSKKKTGGTGLNSSSTTTSTVTKVPVAVINNIKHLGSELEQLSPPPPKKSKDSPLNNNIDLPEQSLKDYCLERDRDLYVRRLRKVNNRKIIDKSTTSTTHLYWNNFSPPPGYLNDVEEQLSESQNELTCHSPAYQLSHSSDRPPKAKPRRRTFDPDCNMDLFDVVSQPEEQSTVSTKSGGTTDTGGENPNLETTFGDEDGLSDSLLCSMTQRLEEEYCSNSNKAEEVDHDHHQDVEMGDEDAGEGAGGGVVNGSFIMVTPDAHGNTNTNGGGHHSNQLCSTPYLRSIISNTSYGSSRGFKEPVRRKLELPVKESVGFENMDDDDDYMDTIMSQIDIPE